MRSIGRVNAEFDMRSKLLKGTLTVLGAVFVSTLGIFASDTLRGIDGNIAGIGGAKEGLVCREGMVAFKHNGNILCVDQFEASPSEKCPFQNPLTMYESEKNANIGDCYAASVKGALPWSFISLPQAERMCAGAGKRIPTGEEWYALALGTNPDSCVIDTTAREVTGTDSCISGSEVYDMIGNVWEWVDETVTDSMFDGRALPADGYVTSVDSNGIAITSAEAPEQLYGADYIWTEPVGVFGMIRGGFYGSESDAGLYAMNASVLTSFASQGVGFRCVEDVM